MPQLLQLGIMMLSMGLALLPFGLLGGSGLVRWAMLVLALPLLIVACPLIAGMTAWPNRSYIRAGRFHRTATDPVYGRRRFHAACWTLLYYSPLWPFVLSWAWLRKAVFRLFGYRGPLEFTVYPDTWVRDLPVLSIGKGAYLANKSTIGTNLVLADGTLLVGPIVIGEGAIVGHLVMVAAGSTFGERSQTLHGTAVGVHGQVGAESVVEATSTLDHYAVVGDRVTIGTMCYVGRRSRVADGLRLPPATFVPAKTHLNSQAEVDALVRKEARDLVALRAQLSGTMAGGSE